MVRKMEPAKALDVLKLTPKAAAKDLGKALGTVLANAKNQGLDAAKLTFAKIEINESIKMRRFRAGTRGRAKPYKKRMSHIKIVLSDEAGRGQIKPDQKTGKPENPTHRHTDAPVPSDLSEKKKEKK